MNRRKFIGLVALLPFTTISINAESKERRHEEIANYTGSTRDNTNTYFTHETLSAFEDICASFEDRCIIC